MIIICRPNEIGQYAIMVNDPIIATGDVGNVCDSCGSLWSIYWKDNMFTHY